MLIAGITFRRFNVFPENSSQVLNQFVIYVSLPALILITIPKLQLSQNFAMVALTPWLALLLSVLLVLLLSHFFNWDRQTKGVLLLLVPLGNTSFLGIPMVKAFLERMRFPMRLFMISWALFWLYPFMAQLSW